MGRRTIEVDRALLQAALTQAENGSALPTQNELWKKTAAIYNAFTVPEQVEFSTLANRAKEWSLVYLTQPGKRGRQPGQAMTPEHKAKLLAGRTGKKKINKAKKFASNPKIVAGFKTMRENFRALAGGGDRFESLINRAEKGSRTAKDALQCLECIGGKTRDAHSCSESCCTNYAFTCGIFKRGQVLQIGQTEDLGLNAGQDEESDSPEAEAA